MKAAIFDNFERNISRLQGSDSLLTSPRTFSAGVTVRASSMTCLHCASADDHGPRMTIVISHTASSDAVHCNIRSSTVLHRDDHNASPVPIRHKASARNCFNVHFIVGACAYS
jgi:hypothetical protein